MTSSSNIALVHDFLLYPGGAEKVLVDLARMFPEAPIYTIVCDRSMLKRIDDAFDGDLRKHDIRTSFLRRFPDVFSQHPRRMAPLLAPAVESFDLREFDTVISSSGAWSKGIVTRTHTRHIAYIHSPMRYVWDYNERYFRERNERVGLIKRMMLTSLRMWDAQAAARPDVLIANSQYTQKRIAKYYRRESTVIYPGVCTGSEKVRDRCDKNGSFLLISRLSPPKRVDIAIDVCNKLQLSLVVVGDGPDRRRLERIAGSTIQFHGWLPQEKLEKQYESARAFLFPTQDDFGIAPVEAMARGVPVIAIPGASAEEIVQDGLSGILCDAPTVDGMADGLRQFFQQEESLRPQMIHGAMQKFSRKAFERSIMEVLQSGQ